MGGERRRTGGRVACRGVRLVMSCADADRDPDDAARGLRIVRLAAVRAAELGPRRGGERWCWGADRNGELGQGRPLRADQPVPVTGLGPRKPR